MKRMAHYERKYVRLQAAFRENWGRLSNSRRVEIHLPSVTLPEHQRGAGLNMTSRQELQFGGVSACPLSPTRR